MKTFDLREGKGKFTTVLIIGIVFAAFGFMMDGGAGTLVLLFGLACAGVSVWKLMQKGKSGVLLSPETVEIELATGEKHTFNYSDIKQIGIQELTMPGYVKAVSDATFAATLFTAPANLFLMTDLYRSDFTCLTFQFNDSTKTPKVGKADTYMYSSDKLNDWSNENKQDLYLAFFNNVSLAKRKSLLEYLEKDAKQKVVVLPALERKAN